VAVLVAPPRLPSLLAQGPRGTEVGLLGVAALAEPEFAGGGVSLAYRVEGRLRLSLGLLAGPADGFTGRGELTAQYLLSPARLTGATLYGFGGVAGQAGGARAGYLVAGLGLEGRPGAGSGWMIEAGIGGGARFAAGWRWRALRAGR
jgi:hypothetical protein